MLNSPGWPTWNTQYFSEHGKLVEFLGNSVQPAGKIITNLPNIHSPKGQAGIRRDLYNSMALCACSKWYAYASSPHDRGWSVPYGAVIAET